MAGTDPAARARRKRELAALVRTLQDQPAGSPAQLAKHLEHLERRGWTVTADIDHRATIDTLTRADRHILILTRTGDLPNLLRRAKLPRLTGRKPQHPDLRKLTHRAHKTAHKRTAGTGWALALQLDGIGLIAARADNSRLISRRTQQAIDAARAAGTRLGRPPAIPPDVRERIHAAHTAGRSPRAIARDLNHNNVPTAQGGPWRHSTIERVLNRRHDAKRHSAPSRQSRLVGSDV